MTITGNNSMQAKLADVGISRIMNQKDVNSLTPMLGSWAYMSPEIRAGPSYDFKTDIWYFFLF